MTAPDTTAPAPGAPPAAPNAAPDFAGMDAMERTIAQTLHESKDLIAADQPVTDRPRDATGRFVSRAEGDWQTVPDAAPAGTAVPADPDAPPAIVIPEGHVIPPTLAPEKVQGWKVRDAEGEIEPPDLTFEVSFRGPNGEAQSRTVDLPRLVDYARMGVYNHRREQQATAIAGENQGLQEQLAEYQTALQHMQRDRATLLSNPDYLVKQLQEFEQANTPEALALRERQELDLQRAQLTFQAASQHNEAFLTNKLEPALDTIAQAYPHVTLEDLANHLATLVQPYTMTAPWGAKIINPQAFTEIAHVVVQQLAPWAEQVHAFREERYGPPRMPSSAPGNAATPAPSVVATPTKAQADAALQVRAQKARRVATAALQQPPGGNGAHAAPATPSSVPTSNRDLQDFIVGRALAATRGA